MVAKVPFEEVKIKLTHGPYFQLADPHIGLGRCCWKYEYAVAFDGIELLFPITVPNDIPEADRDEMAMLYLTAMIAAVAESVEVVL